jgi:hypothetical protein
MKRIALVRLAAHQEANQVRGDYSRVLLVEGRMMPVSGRSRAKIGRPLRDVARSIPFDTQRRTFCVLSQCLSCPSVEIGMGKPAGTNELVAAIEEEAGPTPWSQFRAALARYPE